MWKNGVSYAEILKHTQTKGFRVTERKKLKGIDLDEIVKMCDNVLNYDSTVILKAISEVVGSEVESPNQILMLLQLSSELKYGLPYGAAVHLYELGFSDRVISQEMAGFFNERATYLFSKFEARKQLKIHHEGVKATLQKYPAVFLERLISIKS